MRLEDALEGYWLERRRALSDNTVNDYTLTFRRLCGFLNPNVAIEDITADHLRAFLNHLKKRYKLGDKTLSNVWIALSALWSWAEQELKIAHVIRGTIKRPRYKRKPVQPYTEQEVGALLAATSKSAEWTTRGGRKVKSARNTATRDRAILLTLLDTGMRASELCALTIGDYNPQQARLLIQHGKGDKARAVYVGEVTRKALWKHLQTRPEARPGDALFNTARGGHLTRQNLRKMIAATGRRSCVEHAGVHRFRHTFAITFLRNGGNVLALQDLLGHESMSTVRIYAKLAELDLAAAQRRASPADNWRL